MTYENVEAIIRPPYSNIDEEGRNALHRFVETADDDHPDMPNRITDFLQHGFDLTTPTNIGYSAIHLAALHFKPKILDILLGLQIQIFWANPVIKNNPWSLTDDSGNLPLHHACNWESNISKRKSAKQCLHVLLGYSVEPQVLVRMTNKRGWTPLHYAVKANNLYVVKKLLPYYDEYDSPNTESLPLLNFACSFSCDSKKRVRILRCCLNRLEHRVNHFVEDVTPLKIAVKLRQPKAVRELLKCSNINLHLLDKDNRTPIFYAARNGFSDKGNQCVLELLRKPKKLGAYEYDDLFEVKDSDDKTVFEYVDMKCPQGTMKVLLDAVLTRSLIIRQPAMKKASVRGWFGDNPVVLHHKMENSFYYAISSENNNLLHIECVASYITEIYDNLFKIPESEFVRKAIPKWKNEQRKAVLLHPAMRLFVYEKSRRLQWILRTLLVFQVAWIAVIIWYCYLIKNHEKSISCGVAIGVYITCSSLYEAYECFGKGIARYFRNPTNLLQLLRNVILFVSLSTNDNIEKSLASVGILLSFILTMRHLRNVGRVIGESIDILRQVLEQVIYVLASCCVILIGFTAAIMLAFDEPKDIIAGMNSSIPIPFTKLLVMMSGEIGFDEIGKSLEFDLQFITWMTRHVIFSMFLIGIVIAFYNQLTGVALHKVQDMHEKADIYRVESKIEYIYLVETVIHFVHACCALLSKCDVDKMRWGVKVKSCFHRFNLDTVCDKNKTDQEGKKVFHQIIRVEQDQKHGNGSSLLDKLQHLWENFPDLDKPSKEDYQKMHDLAEASEKLMATEYGE